MPSWVIVGCTRGIGFEYVQQLSATPSNVVVALIRSQTTAGPLNALAAERKNIYAVETDISNPSKLKQTVVEVGKILGDKLDTLVFNAYLAGTENMMLTASAFDGKEADLEREIFEPLKVNLLQQVFTVNAFLPLIRKGSAKKIVYITSGMADARMNVVCQLPSMLGYAVSKASGNMMMAKYAAELKAEGIKTLSLSPGWVATEAVREVFQSPEMFQGILSAFQKLDPSVKGPIPTEQSVRDQIAVIDSLDESKSGMFLSHHGDGNWL